MNKLNHRLIVLGALAAALTLTACDGDEDTTTDDRSAQSDTPHQLEGWQGQLEAERARIEAERPEFYAEVMAAEPVMARNRMPRLRIPAIADPDAAPLLLHRILEGEGSPEVRGALAEALQITRGDFGPAAVELLKSEPTPEVRIGLAVALERADLPSALAGLQLALGDADPRVRAMAAVSAARLVNTEKLADDQALTLALVSSLEDADWDVRRQSAYALGVHRSGAAKAGLAARLADERPEVRLNALRALDRIDPQYVQSLPQLGSLVDDENAKVARLANRIATRDLAATPTP